LYRENLPTAANSSRRQGHFKNKTSYKVKANSHLESRSGIKTGTGMRPQKSGLKWYLKKENSYAI